MEGLNQFFLNTICELNTNFANKLPANTKQSSFKQCPFLWMELLTFVLLWLKAASCFSDITEPLAKKHVSEAVRLLKMCTHQTLCPLILLMLHFYHSFVRVCFLFWYSVIQSLSKRQPLPVTVAPTWFGPSWPSLYFGWYVVVCVPLACVLTSTFTHVLYLQRMNRDSRWRQKALGKSEEAEREVSDKMKWMNWLLQGSESSFWETTGSSPNSDNAGLQVNDNWPTVSIMDEHSFAAPLHWPGPIVQQVETWSCGLVNLCFWNTKQKRKERMRQHRKMNKLSLNGNAGYEQKGDNLQPASALWECYEKVKNAFTV